MSTYIYPESDLTTGKRIRREFAVLLYMQIILLLLFGLNLTFEITLFLVYFLLLSLKQKRILYRIDIKHETKVVELDYYYMVFFSKKLRIPFSELQTRKLHKRQGLGNSCETMEFFKGKQMVGEIRVGGNWKWEPENFHQLSREMEQIQASN